MTDLDANPFVRYRDLLDSHAHWLRAGHDDASFVVTVQEIEHAIRLETGVGLTRTPFAPQPRLAQQIGLDGVDLWVKDDTVNVGGSHKARHLFGLMLDMVAEHGSSKPSEASVADVELAIASCGNAALAAAIVARAVERPLHVFIPPDAPPAIVEELRRFGARITECDRVPGAVGDPTYDAFRQALDEGAVAFSCQGTDAPGTIDGGRTIAWEMADQLAANLGAPARLDRVFVQVGGGALATAVGRGMVDAFRQGWLTRVPTFHAVQTAGAFPLVRAWDLFAENLIEALGMRHPPITSGVDRARVAGMLFEHRQSPVVDQWLAHAAAEPDRYMWAWEETPRSIATGILDDVTYDWLGVVDSMVRTGGWPVIVDEDLLAEANRVAQSATGIGVDPTGTAGLAGVMECTRRAGVPGYGERVAVMFTGVNRG